MAISTLTTDFGSRDGYVGAMKGVLVRIGREPTIVDISHDMPRGDTAHAAWVVKTACREFPADTIHVVVVDPGVGGARRGVVLDAQGQYYVGPAHGVFAYLAPYWARAIAHVRLLAPEVSHTFHGRDVFAPAAAALALTIDPPAIGARVALA